MVPRAAMPHAPVPPAFLARGRPVRVAHGLHGASMPHPPRSSPLCRRHDVLLGFTVAGRLLRCSVRCHCLRARVARRLRLRGLLKRGKGGR